MPTLEEYLAGKGYTTIPGPGPMVPSPVQRNFLPLDEYLMERGLKSVPTASLPTPAPPPAPPEPEPAATFLPPAPSPAAMLPPPTGDIAPDPRFGDTAPLPTPTAESVRRLRAKGFPVNESVLSGDELQKLRFLEGMKTPEQRLEFMKNPYAVTRQYPDQFVVDPSRLQQVEGGVNPEYFAAMQALNQAKKAQRSGLSDQLSEEIRRPGGNPRPYSEALDSIDYVPVRGSATAETVPLTPRLAELNAALERARERVGVAGPASFSPQQMGVGRGIAGMIGAMTGGGPFGGAQAAEVSPYKFERGRTETTYPRLTPELEAAMAREALRASDEQTKTLGELGRQTVKPPAWQLTIAKEKTYQQEQLDPTHEDYLSPAAAKAIRLDINKQLYPGGIPPDVVEQEERGRTPPPAQPFADWLTPNRFTAQGAGLDPAELALRLVRDPSILEGPEGERRALEAVERYPEIYKSYSRLQRDLYPADEGLWGGLIGGFNWLTDTEQTQAGKRASLEAFERLLKQAEKAKAKKPKPKVQAAKK